MVILILCLTDTIDHFRRNSNTRFGEKITLDCIVRNFRSSDPKMYSSGGLESYGPPLSNALAHAFNGEVHANF